MGETGRRGQGKLFAIGDVHGCAAELRSLLEKLPLTSDSTIVFVGDYIDRGAHSKEVIETIFDLADAYPVVTLMGNHEGMLLDFIADPHSEDAGMFIYHGGSATLASYADDDGKFSIPEAHLAFFEGLPLSYQTDEFFFVHAGVPNIPLESLNLERHGRQMLWLRKPFRESTYTWSRKIVHGHSPVKKVEMCRNRINIDTGCVHNRRLTAIQLPEGTVYTAKRQPEPLRVHLRDKSSRRMAVRFKGAVPVYVRRSQETHAFETVDYSEFGMYMRDTSQKDKPLFAAGDIVVGDIGSRTEERVAFEGEIVRVGDEPEGSSYAMKMFSPPIRPGDE